MQPVAFEAVGKMRSYIGQLLKYLKSDDCWELHSGIRMGQQDSGNGAGIAALMVFYGSTISSRVEHIRFSQDHIWSCQAKKKTIMQTEKRHASHTPWELNDAACEWVCTDKWQAWIEKKVEETSESMNCHISSMFTVNLKVNRFRPLPQAHSFILTTVDLLN